METRTASRIHVRGGPLFHTNVSVEWTGGCQDGLFSTVDRGKCLLLRLRVSPTHRTGPSMSIVDLSSPPLDFGSGLEDVSRDEENCRLERRGPDEDPSPTLVPSGRTGVLGEVRVEGVEGCSLESRSATFRGTGSFRNQQRRGR